MYELGKARTASATEMGYYTPTIAGFKSDAHNDARAFIAEVVVFTWLLEQLQHGQEGTKGGSDKDQGVSEDANKKRVRSSAWEGAEGPSSENRPDGGYDFKVLGISFDVKFTEHKDGRLIFQSIKKFRADAAMLVVPGDSELEFRIVGGIMRERWYKEVCTMQLNPKIGRIAWVVGQEKLTEPRRIVEWLRKRL